MTDGRLETESRCQECLAIIKGEVTSNNLSKRRVRIRTHGVVGGRGLVAPSYPIGFCIFSPLPMQLCRCFDFFGYADSGPKLLK